MHQNLAARKLFEQIIHEPYSTHFKVLPDILLFPSYYQYITRPVSLADIAMAINSGARYTVEDMHRDIKRMVYNAKRFNQTDSQVYQDAIVLEVRSLKVAALKFIRHHLANIPD